MVFWSMKCYWLMKLCHVAGVEDLLLKVDLKNCYRVDDLKIWQDAAHEDGTRLEKEGWNKGSVWSWCWGVREWWCHGKASHPGWNLELGFQRRRTKRWVGRWVDGQDSGRGNHVVRAHRSQERDALSTGKTAQDREVLSTGMCLGFRAPKTRQENGKNEARSPPQKVAEGLSESSGIRNKWSELGHVVRVREVRTEPRNIGLGPLSFSRIGRRSWRWGLAATWVIKEITSWDGAWMCWPNKQGHVPEV